MLPWPSFDRGLCPNDQPVMTLVPTREDWAAGRTTAGLATHGHDDMHAGEIEGSVLRHIALIWSGWARKTATIMRWTQAAARARHRGLCNRSRNLPQGADRHGAKLVSERQRGCAGVKDDAGDEVVAEAVGESA